MRTIVVNSELPSAHKWESTRYYILRRWGCHEEAEKARAYANNFAAKLLDTAGVYVARIE